jgi:glycosyltransferase involved in cell wall biosynthesis
MYHKSAEPEVAFVLDSLAIGGTERSTLAIVARLPRARVIALHGASPDLSAEAEQLGVSVVRLGLDKRAPLVDAARVLRRELIRFSPSVVHSALFRADVAARIASIGAPWQLVTSLVNDSYGEARTQGLGPSAMLRLRLVQAVDALTIAAAQCVVANSRAIAETNGRALSIPSERIVVIPRGRDLNVFTPPAPKERRLLRERLDVAGDGIVIVNVARLIERKGHRTLLGACALLPDDARLLLVGEGPERGALMAQARALGVEGKVRFLGNRRDVADILRAADVFAFPSRYEGFPGAVVEALACGIPVVASRIPMHEEAIEDGRTGLLVPVASVDAPKERQAEAAAWSEAIVRAAEPGLKERLARKARQVAESRYSIEAVAEAHQTLYRTLVLS